MQLSIRVSSLFIPDKSCNSDDHKQQHEKLKGVIDNGDVVEVNHIEDNENAVVVKKCDNDAAVEKEWSDREEYRWQFPKYAPEIYREEQEADPEPHMEQVECVNEHGYTSSPYLSARGTIVLDFLSFRSLYQLYFFTKSSICISPT